MITVENVDKEPRNPTPKIVTTLLAGFEATKKPIKNDAKTFTIAVLIQSCQRFKFCKRHRIDAPEPAKNKKRIAPILENYSNKVNYKGGTKKFIKEVINKLSKT